jgi:hypothetical protein
MISQFSALEETATISNGALCRLGASAPGLEFIVPKADLTRFGALPDDVKDEVGVLLGVMKYIAAHGRVNQACKEQGQLFHGKRGFSWQSLRRKWYAFQKEGWTALVDWSVVGGQREELSAAFVQWFKALAEKNQRKTRPAYRVFKAMWHRGEIIPGLDNSLRRDVLPAGTSYANLARRVADAFALTAMRNGLGVARAAHGPMILTTRAGLWPMSHVMIDDLWHDNFVIYRGAPVRVLEFDAIDVFSACKIGWGTKPRMQREDGSMEGLQEKFVRMLLAQVFFQHGFNPERGTTLMAEHGTAAVREDLEKLLFDRTGGKITVRRSGITGKEQAVKGMFPGRGGGNPRFKSPLESLRNLIHNELASLPGQTGLNYTALPEQTAGEVRHNTELLKAVAVLAERNPDRAALIKLSLLQYHSQFLPLLGEVYETINRRDWHDLEGWSKCGFIVPQLNDAGAWVSAESLPVAKRDVLLALAKMDKGYSREIKLSPRQVFNRGCEQLEKIPAFVVAEMLGNDFAREERIAHSYFEFQDQELDPEPLRFESRITDPEGNERELSQDKYQVFVNPFDLNQLFVHDARGRHLGIARRAVRVSRADDEALKRQFGRAEHRLNDLLKPIRERHADLTREGARRNAHNADVIAGKPMTVEEKERARAMKNFSGDLGSLAEPEATTNPATETEEGDTFSTEGLL